MCIQAFISPKQAVSVVTARFELVCVLRIDLSVIGKENETLTQTHKWSDPKETYKC